MSNIWQNSLKLKFNKKKIFAERMKPYEKTRANLPSTATFVICLRSWKENLLKIKKNFEVCERTANIGFSGEKARS